MRVLVANRGEIALRILRTCREMGLTGIAVFSDADRESLPVRYADEAIYIGKSPSAESYLNIHKILQAAKDTGANAIHPGYGFLSENSMFARMVEEAGLIFIGPRSQTIELTGDKLAARRIARQAGLPVLPGPDQPIQDEIPSTLRQNITFPVLIKAVAGGGGKGIRLANDEAELEEMLSSARQEALKSFGDDTVYLEPLVQKARHIEVQIIGDGNGNILCLGDRECSIQRRRQKLIEEAPAPDLSPALRNHLYESALQMGKALNYRSLGTVEFLVDDRNDFYFIEINPRIQVEHPITEMVTGLDLVRAQLQLAKGEPLQFSQEDIITRGSAIEARIIAEDPDNGFLPVTGEISYIRESGGPGIRIDSALYPGLVITPEYDSLLAKVAAYAEDRNLAIRRLRRALKEFEVGGLSTDIDFLIQIIDSEPFLQGRATTTYVDTFQPIPSINDETFEMDLALTVAMIEHNKIHNRNKSEENSDGFSYWKFQAWKEQMR
ncbi:acetyl/propionyl/methylcrotonyl-CoA carboxylase subunit alpha [Leptolinea tardivitalis]|uniref:biotin carboxylase n=1 Tax=Leptolinea tardivitalis TaxID=229920 RepID=A0A0P6WZU9_9CHLR|nr:biotin carboxylase N-terminal domain-containing protein [Leptolinea tardivitalis]KPL72397.1 hypothetical protein ADM99_08210 [Leptolinea tardivitalis]GAP22767.1 biotin carboxylase [Leptolinea tardivitalis]